MCSMGFYAQKTTSLWGDVSLHEALNGQVGGGHHRGRNEHKDWAAGYFLCVHALCSRGTSRHRGRVDGGGSERGRVDADEDVGERVQVGGMVLVPCVACAC